MGERECVRESRWARLRRKTFSKDFKLYSCKFSHFTCLKSILNSMRIYMYIKSSWSIMCMIENQIISAIFLFKEGSPMLCGYLLLGHWNSFLVHKKVQKQNENYNLKNKPTFWFWNSQTRILSYKLQNRTAPNFGVKTWLAAQNYTFWHDLLDITKLNRVIVIPFVFNFTRWIDFFIINLCHTFVNGPTVLGWTAGHCY